MKEGALEHVIHKRGCGITEEGGGTDGGVMTHKRGEGPSPFAELEKSDEGSPWVWRAFNMVSQPCSRDLTLEFGKTKSNLRWKTQVTYLSLSSAFSLSCSALSLRPLSWWSWVRS